jgi:hypothetical protein
MQKRLSKYGLSSILLLISLVWSNCSEEPTSVGIGLVSSQDLVQVDTATVTAVATSVLKKPINTGGSDNLLVGKYRTTDGKTYEAKTLLRFTGFPDTLKSVTVLSANLILGSKYRFGDPQGSLSFNVYKMTQGWTEYGVTWDSISTASYDPIVRGNFSSAIADSDSVAVPLDPSLISDWFQEAADSQTIQGIILAPTDASTKIVGFSSFQSLDASREPQLLVTFLSSDGTVQDSLLFITGEDTYVANIDNLPSDPNLLYVQAGIAYRSTVQFGLDSIPLHVGINRAILELTRDRSSAPPSSRSIDSLVSVLLVSSDSVDITTFVLGSRVDPDSDVYSFVVTPEVQQWVSAKPNYGLQIDAYAESSQLDLFTFHSASASLSLRPRLRIIYSRRQ